MNINTNALLNSLLTKVDSTLKSKIEKHSIDGKVDISGLGKEKGIESLLSQLFKDISTGTKNKSEVSNLLENSKQSLKFKNISSELKQVVNLINQELTKSPELEKLTSLLKTSLVDIKSIDEKIIKSSFQNSGVFLESKISPANDSVSTNLKTLINNLNDKMKILNTMDKLSPNNTSINQNIEKILINISEIENKKSIVKPEVLLKEVPNTTKIINTNNDITIQNKPVLSNGISGEVENILKKVIQIQDIPQIEKQLNSLQSAMIDIKSLEPKITTLNIKNEIVLNLNELIQQAKNNLLNNTSQKTEKTLFIIKEQLENIKSNNLTEFKNEIKNIDLKMEKFHNDKNIESKLVLIKDLIQTTEKIFNKLNTGNIQELLKNNISELKNISGDLKSIILKIKEFIEQPQNTDNVSKELKNTVDKIISQIDYYQLSSYSSNTNHSYLSFLQEELEDVDIQFSANNNEEFSCLIDLSLKEKGDLKILLQLDRNKSININIGVEQEEFKLMIQDALQQLRIQINSLGLSIVSLNVFDLDDNIEKSTEIKAYTDNQNLDFGLDIKV